MSKSVFVEAELREGVGKNAARRFRRAGRVPAVVYGAGGPVTSISVDPRSVEDVLGLETGRNTIFNLSVVGQDRPAAVMIREIQRDPVGDRLLHVDLVRVDLDKAITVSVPVRLVGTPEGVKNQGGVIEFMVREVEVECLPGDIPERLDVDVTSLTINQHVSVSDLPSSDRYRVLADSATILAVVAPPRAEEEVAAPAEEAAPAAQEPEVIRKGKEAAEGEEAPAKEKGSKEK